MQPVTLIIDKRHECSMYYKEILESGTNKVLVSADLITAIKIIRDKEPDLIIISDSFDDDLSDFCKQVRALTYNMRPVIVAISQAPDFSAGIKVLESGADDFITEPVNPEEFKVRMTAHLRREYESNIDSSGLLPNRNYTMRAIKRKLSDDDTWAMLYINIENFQNYKLAYTNLASDKLLQTYGAIIGASLNESDYLGMLAENVFFVITDTLKAERLARFLIFAFDSVAGKFYAEHDLDRGYMILRGDEYAGCRADFVRSPIGVVTNEFIKYKDTAHVLNTLMQITELADVPGRSNYLMERPKLSGENSVYRREFNNKILIYETDEALSILLNTIFNLQGYKTEIIDEYRVPEDYEEPAVIIIDAGDLEKKNGLNLCCVLKQHEKFKTSKIIVTSVVHNKEIVLNTGADMYLPKPYEVSCLVKAVNKYIREYNG